MLANLFLNLTEYAFFRRLVWKPIYESVARFFPYDSWVCMNYGYASDADKIPLETQDEINRYSLQLYHNTVSTVDVTGKHVLEVGSGRGGGSSYIKRYLKPASMTGMDLAKNAVSFSNRRHPVPDLKFVKGNAEKMPFANESFDAVVNVESCHAYGSVPKFLSEVRRVLKPGGYLLCTDIRAPKGMKLLIQQLNDSGLQIVNQKDITANVILAIEEEDEQKRQRIKELMPGWIAPAFIEFGAAKGSAVDTGLHSGELVYYHWTLQKN